MGLGDIAVGSLATAVAVHAIQVRQGRFGWQSLDSLGAQAGLAAAASLGGFALLRRLVSCCGPREYVRKIEGNVAYKQLGKSEFQLEDVPELVSELRESYNRGVSRPLATRVRQLKALLRLVEENEQKIVDALHKDLGRPRMEAVLYDVLVVKHEIQTLIKNLPRWAAPQKKGFSLITFPSSDYLQPEPHGNVLVIGTWNYPVMLCLIPLAGAIAAGNTVCLKPCNVSPHSARLMAELIPKYLDPTIVSVIGANMRGDRDCTAALMKERWGYVFFTGSPSIGKVVYEAAAKHLTPVTLELGGKNPVIVDRSANINIAAKRIVWGRMMNAGQQCIGPDYVLVHKDVEHLLTERMMYWIETLYGKDAKKEGAIGNIVNERHTERLIKIIQDPKSEVVYGGEYDVATKWIAPTIIRTTFGSHALEDETFGPIVLVTPVSSVDEAIAYCNERERPLSMYVFANDKKVVGRILQNTSAGGVTVNGTLMQAAHHELPFGGVGSSGMGSYHGKATFDTFTHYKPVCGKLLWPDFGLLSDPVFIYPPWTGWKETIMRKLFTLA